MSLFDKINKKISMKISKEELPDLTEISAEYKILVLGDSQVGKTSLCNRLSLNEFNLEIKPTTQSKCYAKTIKLFDQLIQLYLIDIDDQTYKTQKNVLYSDVKGAIIVYNITEPSSFESIDDYIKDIRAHLGDNIPLLLIGNKTDLSSLKVINTKSLIIKAKEYNTNDNCEISEVNCIEKDLVKKAIKKLIANIYYESIPKSQQEHFDNLFNPKVIEKKMNNDDNK